MKIENKQKFKFIGFTMVWILWLILLSYIKNETLIIILYAGTGYLFGVFAKDILNWINKK